MANESFRDRPSGLLAWLERHATALCRASAYLVSVLVVAPFFYHLAKGSPAFLGLMEDDYFYYAIIADKLVRLGRLTYDGITVTNGFHPLWFAVIWITRLACGELGTAFYVVLSLICIGCMFVTYELGRRLALALGASVPVAAVVPAVFSLGTGKLLSNGMECIIAVPLYLWFLLEVLRPIALTPSRAAKLGFIASLAILARLDIAMAVGLLIAGFIVFVRPRLPELIRLLLAFSAGGILVPVYAALNMVIMGSPLPVSAMAKRLQTSQGFSIGYAYSVALLSVYGPAMLVLLPLGALALLLLLFKTPGVRSRGRVVGGLTLAFMFLFFGLNALSGWILFGWYAYPMTAGIIISLVFAMEVWGPLVTQRAVWVTVAAALVLLQPLLAVRYYREHGPGWSVADNSLLATGYDVAEHMKGRNGLFAMGAIAGMVTYVLDKPVLQLEGIVADRKMVEHVRNQDPLGDVLREYGADYLIVSLANVRSSPHDGCYLVTQPNAEWAGERTAKMSGEICAEPIAHFVTPQGPNPWSIFPAIETLIWDLRGARWRTPTS